MKSIKVVLVLALMVLSSGCGIEQVDEGYRGIKRVWGKIDKNPLAPGLYFYNPISSSISEVSVMEKKYEGTTLSFTRDTQQVSVAFAATAYPKQNEVTLLYAQFGNNWEETIINPAIMGSLKDSIGLYIADDLVGKREQVKQSVQKELREALDSRGVVLTRFDITNLDFDDAYEKAVEAKVVAVQRAAEAKNKTVQVQEEAKQVVTSAKADAEAMKIKSQALSQNKGLVEYEAVKRWDGAMPQIMLGNGSTPFIDLRNIQK